MMQKLVIQETLNKIESVLKQQDLPMLTTLRQGVIVLSRQWKNMLYNPMLFEHQYKNKLNRPINVTFAVPHDEVSATDSIDLPKVWTSLTDFYLVTRYLKTFTRTYKFQNVKNNQFQHDDGLVYGKSPKNRMTQMETMWFFVFVYVCVCV